MSFFDYGYRKFDTHHIIQTDYVALPNDELIIIRNDDLVVFDSQNFEEGQSYSIQSEYILKSSFYVLIGKKLRKVNVL